MQGFSEVLLDGQRLPAQNLAIVERQTVLHKGCRHTQRLSCCAAIGCVLLRDRGSHSFRAKPMNSARPSRVKLLVRSRHPVHQARKTRRIYVRFVAQDDHVQLPTDGFELLLVFKEQSAGIQRGRKYSRIVYLCLDTSFSHYSAPPLQHAAAGPRSSRFLTPLTALRRDTS